MSDRIEGEIGAGARQASVGSDIQQVSIYTDSLTWRDAVRAEFQEIHREIDDLRGWVRGLLVAVCVAFALGFVLSALMIRQFDLDHWRIQQLEQRRQSSQPAPTPAIPFIPVP